MGKSDKILKKMQDNPKNVDFKQTLNVYLST